MAQLFPVEIFAYFIDFVSPSDLFHISTTQRTLGAIAERRLYRNMSILTNAETFVIRPWFWGSESSAVCLRRSVLAQLALIKRPHRFQYVRFLSLDGRYHRSPKFAELDDVIDQTCLARMVCLREVECIDLRIRPSFRSVFRTTEGIEALYSIRCSFYTSRGLETPCLPFPWYSLTKVKLAYFSAEPATASGWDLYLQKGLKDLDIGPFMDGINTRLLAALCVKGLSDTLMSLTISWTSSEDFAVALSDVLSSCQAITSLTIISLNRCRPAITLPRAAIPNLKAFSGPHELAPTFVPGRPVESVDIRWFDHRWDYLDDRKIDANMLVFLRLSTTEVTELRLHCDLGTSYGYYVKMQTQWLEAISRIPEITPSLRILVLGTIPMITDFNPIYPEEFATTILPRMTALVQLHFNQKGVFGEPVDDQTRTRRQDLELALRDRGPCERRDQIVNVCTMACPSLRRIIFGQGLGWGGCERLDSGEWVMFFWAERDDFWRVDTVKYWPSPARVET